MGDTAGILKLVTVLLDLYEKEGMIKPKADFYQLAAYAWNNLGQEDQALEFAKLAKKFWTILFGVDSPEVREIEEFERNPKGHPTRGNP